VLEADAQSTGQVSGRVVDQMGAALRGAAVALVVSSRELTATTDQAGEYRFDAVPAGNAELTVRLLDFSVLRRRVTVAGGASVTADAVLTLSLSADVTSPERAHSATSRTSRIRRPVSSASPRRPARAR
jgi:hypothetical protein